MVSLSGVSCDPDVRSRFDFIRDLTHITYVFTSNSHHTSNDNQTSRDRRHDDYGCHLLDTISGSPNHSVVDKKLTTTMKISTFALCLGSAAAFVPAQQASLESMCDIPARDDC